MTFTPSNTANQNWQYILNDMNPNNQTCTIGGKTYSGCLIGGDGHDYSYSITVSVPDSGYGLMHVLIIPLLQIFNEYNTAKNVNNLIFSQAQQDFFIILTNLYYALTTETELSPPCFFDQLNAQLLDKNGLPIQWCGLSFIPGGDCNEYGIVCTQGCTSHVGVAGQFNNFIKNTIGTKNEIIIPYISYLP